ncbi:MAG: AAA family ATPase [Chloroflexi bacterium]|nr:AAA family ATPase [Chloroflexota bacterium]MBI3175729.1 AAA family ATPase [Chloroflexota bacterium]
MAKLYPEYLPESIYSDPKRSAEKRVFEALSKLPSLFVVFYSVAWQARKDGYTRDGEADFVIAHPDLGVLVFEVKGGGVAYDAATGQWTTTDRYGQSFVIDPVEQAKKSHYTLLEKFKDLPEWDSARFLTIGHAICFPDIVVENKSLRLDLSRDIVVDHNDLAKIEETIQRVFEHYADKTRRAPLGRDRLAIVEGLLARSFKMTTPLGVELDNEDKRLIELTERQFMLLDFLASRRRALIAGCAGSGKTMLAVEKARQLHEQGFNVLLTCFNLALAEDLAKRLPDITVLHFHGLCREVAKEVGFTIQSVSDQQKYYDETLPEMLLKAVDETGPMFDAIIVDEGQDFLETYWVALASLLNEKEGIFYVFYDDNQNLYGGGESLKGIVNEEPFLLTENCRNTKAIHKVVSAFYSDRKRIGCKGPEGRTPELHEYKDSAELLKGVQSVLNKLVNEEHVAAEEIVILTPYAQEKTSFKIGTRLGNFTLSDLPPQRRNEIQATTIHKFKGLERKVVIITEVDDKFRYNPETLMYVGSSRARTHLIFFVAQNAPTEIKSQIEADCKPTR